MVLFSKVIMFSTQIGTKFKNAFQFAFSRFKNSLSSGNATACETAMVIITDGDIKDIRGKLVNYVIEYLLLLLLVSFQLNKHIYLSSCLFNYNFVNILLL